MSLRGYEHDTSAGTRDVIVTRTRRRTLGAWPAGAAFSGLSYFVPKDFVVLVATVPRSRGLEGHVFRRLLLGHPLTQAWQRYRATRADAGRRRKRKCWTPRASGKAWAGHVPGPTGLAWLATEAPQKRRGELLGIALGAARAGRGRGRSAVRPGSGGGSPRGGNRARVRRGRGGRSRAYGLGVPGAWVDLRALTIELISRGRKDIPSDTYNDGQPLHLDVGAHVVEVLQVTSEPPTLPHPCVSAEETSLKIGPSLIGRRHRITLTVLTDGGPPSLTCKSSLIDVQVRRRADEQALQDAVVPWVMPWLVVLLALLGGALLFAVLAGAWPAVAALAAAVVVSATATI